ncbi:MAG: hypothetical protein JO102_04295 [Elusimicrobia bacterium]|nr:hypothetical protein [Elusimicrobiota bacterium]
MLLSSLAAADPHVNGVDGTMDTGGRARIKGDGFGEKKEAKPIAYADFEKGLDPSPKGQKSKWDGIENFTWGKEGPDGGGCAVGVAGKGPWTICVEHHYWSKEGGFAYVFRRQRMNFIISDPSQNWKIWRMWPEEGTNYPNIYMASSNGEVNVENVGERSGYYGRFNPMSTDWLNEEILFRASNMDVKDGLCTYKCNGVEMASGAVMTRSSRAPAYMARNYGVHAVPANLSRWSPPWSPTNQVWVAELYVDDSWSRVMLGDKPLRREGRRWEIQIPTKWTDSEIEINVNSRIFKPGETAYLYVFNANNRCNERGYPVHVGPVAVASARGVR